MPEGVTTINPGDWVAISKEYATAEAQLEGSTIISATAQAKDLWSEGLLEEWGYHGTTVLSQESTDQAKESIRSNFPTNRSEYAADYQNAVFADLAIKRQNQELRLGIND